MMQCEARVVKAEGGWESRGWVSRWRVMGDGVGRMGESVSSCTLARWLAKRPKPGDLSPRDGLPVCMEAVVVCREYKAVLLIIVAVR